MAKKVLTEKEKLSAKLVELEAKEQTAEVMAEIDNVKEQIDALEVKPEVPAKKAPEKKGRFTDYDVWRMEWKGTGNERKLMRVNLKKTVNILDEHAAILNEQTANTLLLYVKKGE